jgi:tetratricopeptide (TPR) repeat protein
MNLLFKDVCFFLIALNAFGQLETPKPAEKYAQEGESALASGRYEEAQRAYEKLRELEPGVAEVHANLGLIYFEEKKFEQAVPALRQALKLKPSLSKSDNILAMSLSELGRYKEALPGLDKGFSRSSDPEIRRMCGLQLLRAYTGLKRDNKAVEVALQLNRLYADDPEVLYQTGKIYGNVAYQTMHKLWHVGPDSIWRHQAAAEAYESQAAFDQALIQYRAVLEADPRRPGIHYRIGRTLLSRQREHNTAEGGEEAAQEFEQELQIDPSNANAAYELGEIHRRAERLKQAQQLFEQSLQFYPDFEEAHLGLSAVFISENKPQQALLHLQKAVAINPQNEVAWYRLSVVQRALGNSADQEKALAEFKRLHEKSSQQNLTTNFLTPQEVTKQEIDANASQ